MKIKCMSKNRDSKGAIVDYTLVDETGKRFQATGQQIKEEMKTGKYEFVNLQLDKAGRLIDKAEDKVEETPKVDKVLERYRRDTIRLMLDKAIHMTEENKLTFIKNVVYHSEPGIKYLGKKYCFDEKVIKEALNNAWITPGAKLWEHPGSYPLANSNYQYFDDGICSVDEFVNYVNNNIEQFRLYKAIDEMKNLLNEVHEFVSYMNSQKRYQGKETDYSGIKVIYENTLRCLLAWGKAEAGNSYRNYISTRELRSNEGADIYKMGFYHYRELIKAIKSNCKASTDFIMDIIELYSAKNVASNYFDKVKNFALEYNRLDNYLKENHRKVYMNFSSVTSKGYHSSIEVEILNKN